MIAKSSLARSDIRPLEFAIAVIVGGIGSALLSGMQKNPLVSVVFALLVMAVLAFLRWRIASEVRDHQSLEAFAEDIYLLGYLLTLAALLGLAPRLMSDDSNLFHIAGVKLVTTVFGLGLMMIFRQTARRWAEEMEARDTGKFVEQQQQFTAAVGRLNQGADELVAKMEEVAHRFDPDLLTPVAEWSNRAANAFSAATRALEALPQSVGTGTRAFQELDDNLGRARSALLDLAGVVANNSGPATKAFATDLAQAGLAANGLAVTITGLRPAADATRGALERLGSQTIQEVGHFVEINQSIERVAVELGKVEATMRSLASSEVTDLSAPLVQVVQALQTSSDRAITSTEQMQTLGGRLEGMTTTTRDLGAKLESIVLEPLNALQESLARVTGQLARAAEQVERAAQGIERCGAVVRSDSEVQAQLLKQVALVHVEMREANAQIRSLVASVGGSVVTDHKVSLLRRWFGGGDSGSGNT